MLKSVKNLRSQVCRAAIQAVQVVFLNVGKSLETDSDTLVKELMQKSADTNKFIRYLLGNLFINWSEVKIIVIYF